MAEKLIAPGVFTNENDLSYVPQGVQEIGAAIIGPTVKGRALVPTYVQSYTEFQQLFGDTYKSGSLYYEYLTSISAREYLKNGTSLLVTRIMAGDYGPATSSVAATGSGNSFTLTTLGDGAILNSTGDETLNGVLENGTKDNLRWEITNTNTTKGTFTLLIRRGNDSAKRKVVLETWNNLDLDPNSSNYISKRIGDQTYQLGGSGTTTPYLQPTGSFTNKSNYVRVSVLQPTIDYLDENGNIRVAAASASLPTVASGTFGGGSDGNINHPQNFFESISNTNTQGYVLNVDGSGSTAYQDAIGLLSNQYAYDFNLLVMPGVIDNFSNHTAIVTKAIDMVESRGDCMFVYDLVAYGSTVADATSEAGDRDSNYAATYWPWIKWPSVVLGRDIWIPVSTIIPSVYAFNDTVGYEWYAPAGFNRASLYLAKEAEKKLTRPMVDSLYDNNVNPIMTYTGDGIVIWGQKTLQKRATALDRINVRRLLIKSKKYVASISKYLVFEQNSNSTRKRFLNTVNPWFEDVKTKNGLYDFRVVMDETNNTPDVIDRLQMKGEIWIKPTRTAEYIVVDFNIMPTGAEFPE